VLVDTSVWIDHFRRGKSPLAECLEAGEVEGHPFVAGELACGNLRRRDEILSLLATLPQVTLAGHEEVLHFLDSRRLYGRGFGWVDLHLLVSAILSRTTLWTRDRNLAEQARRLGVAFEPG
jgi:predicted nucleic acid-binding protein